MRTLSIDQIETLNAHGPYNHSAWTGGAGVLTHEEALEGRGRFIADTLLSVLTTRFSGDRLARMSILDVGCYDGWILHQIGGLPLRRLVGVEPRSKNIRKGEVARSILGIETRVEFVQGGIENLAESVRGEIFDIVVATGLLHHVESPAAALRSLRQVCGELLFLETITLDSRHIGAAARAEIEPKDVVYFGRPKTVGMCGNKLESSYYDGSATGLSVVGIPSIETIALCCEAAGFSPPRLEVNPAGYRRAMWRGKRPFHAAILTAEPAPRQTCQDLGHGQAYERKLAAARIRREDLAPLHQRFCLGKTRVAHTEVSRAVSALIGKRGERAAGTALERLVESQVEREILRSFAHSPAGKIALEMGKTHLADNDPAAAEIEFRRVTGGWNADWRSTYRAFHYLAAIARSRGLDKDRRRYEELLAVANPHFPARAWPEDVEAEEAEANGLTRAAGMTRLGSSSPLQEV